MSSYKEQIKALEKNIEISRKDPELIKKIEEIIKELPGVYEKANSSTYKSVGKFYMTKPFGNRAVETKITGRFADVQQVNELTELELLADYPDKNANKGDKLLVRGDNFNMPWAKQVLKAGDVEFILVPEDFGVLVVKG